MAGKLKIFEIDYTYQKQNNVSVTRTDDIIMPDQFEKKYEGVVIMPPGTIAGNHFHPRSEIFIAFGDITIFYIEDGKLKEANMNNYSRDKLKIFYVPPFLPHAVKNLSKDQSSVLLEFADSTENKPETYQLIDG